MPIVIVCLESGVWIADREGDPGRTLKKENAKNFSSMTEALLALKEARKWRPFVGASVEAPWRCEECDWRRKRLSGPYPCPECSDNVDAFQVE